MGIKFDTCFLAQVVDALAVLAARKGYIVTLRGFKSAKPLEGNAHLVLGAKQSFFQKHLNKSTAFAITYLPFSALVPNQP